MGGAVSVIPIEAVVAKARADLAGRLDVNPGEIELVSAEAVSWRDASVGCPQPGMAYAQVVTSGTRIVLASGAEHYEYHSDNRLDPFLCENPEPPLAS
jgi:hypothetical protein